MAEEAYEKFASQPYYSPAPLDIDFTKNFKAFQVTSLEMLDKICSVKDKVVGFDTETTGLVFFEDKMVGCSISFNGDSGFYVPLRHENPDGTPADFNLPIKESINLIYNKLMKNNTILLYNSCFDLTMVGQELWQIGLPFNDIETIKFLDVLCLVYLLEPEIKKNSLKWASRHFLGRIAPTFEQITGISKKSKDKKHFGQCPLTGEVEIKPTFIELKGAKKKLTTLDIQHNEDMQAIGTYYSTPLKYACYDSGSTYALYEKLIPVVEKMWAKHKAHSNEPFALETDCRLAKAMLHYKHIPISFNAKLMQEDLIRVKEELEETQAKIFEVAGEVFNINSTQQKRVIFNKLGLNTGVQTKTGMSVSKSAIKNLDHPIIELLNKYSSLNKSITAYFEPLSKDMIGRINYKTTTVATGRLSSGKGDQSENSYYSSISIQTLPKAKNRMFEVVHVGLDSADPDAILGYKFHPVTDGYMEGNPDKTYIEGFNKDLNVRDCLGSPHHIYVKDGNKMYDFKYDIEKAEFYVRMKGLSKDSIITELSHDWYVVSCDFSAEELCIIANLSHEPSFVKPLLEGADLHLTMAKSMFGGKYDFDKLDPASIKNLRKKAKAGNFGLAYRGSYKALARDIPDEQEAMEVYEKWWANMSIYKQWQQERIDEMMMYNDGDATNLYGRMRRFKPMLGTGNMGDVNAAIRAACNHYVQGVGADLVRICMARCYEEILKQNKNSNEIRFLASIHDELAFVIRKDVIEKWVYEICNIMETSYPKDFIVPLKASPQIGTSMGFGFDFDFDRDDQGNIIKGSHLHLVL